MTTPSKVKPVRWLRTPVVRSEVTGIRVPESIAAIREVAEWVREQPGHTVPFLSREGLLVRSEFDGGTVWHEWVEAGHILGFDGDDESLVSYGNGIDMREAEFTPGADR